MAQITTHLIEAMGFKHDPDGLRVRAKFHCINVYQIFGLSWTKRHMLQRQLKIDGIDLVLTIGNSLNKMCEKILGDDFCENEVEWVKEKHAHAPFAMMYIKSPEFSEKNCHYYQELKGNIHTYDTFADEKGMIKDLERKIIPRTLLALSSTFKGLSKEPIFFCPVETAYFGISDSGRTIIDTRIELSGSISVNRMVERKKILTAISNAELIGESVDRQAAEFFYDAVGEKDLLKKFLFLFLFIERQTHSDFSKCMKRDHGKKFSLNGSQKKISKLSYFRDISRTPGLADKFIWCSNFFWNNISEEEIAEFLRLKKIRDDIAHGNAKGISQSDVRSAEELAKAICRPKG